MGFGVIDPALKLPANLHVFERGWLSSNNVLIADDTQTALIDTGYALHAEQTLALVRHCLADRPLDLIINTHLHSDHCGGNGLLQKIYDCKTLVPRADGLAVAQWNVDLLGYAAMRQRCERFTLSGTLGDGDRIDIGPFEWEILAAPGHDPHANLLYCRAGGLLISGDALWEDGFGVVFPELEGNSGFAETRATLDRIAALDVRIVIPGHGSPFSAVKPALDRAYGRLEYLTADPVRNARHAVRALLKFFLLEVQSIEKEELARVFPTIPLIRETNARYFGWSDTELTSTATAHLIKVGAAAEVAGKICNLDR